MLGADWRENLGLPDGDIGGDPSHLRAIVALIRRARAEDHRGSVRARSASRSRRRQPPADARGVSQRPGALRRGRREVARRLAALLLHQRFDAAVVRGGRSAHYATKRAALACHRSQFAPPSTGAAATRLNTPRFQQLIESRDAQFGALIGVDFAEGVVVRELLAREHLLK